MEKSGRVFMLDDDMIVLNLYHDLLESQGYDVFTTNNAYKFLLYAKEIIPDVLVLDINMPEVTGWEIVRRISKENKLKDIPVIVFTVETDKALADVKGVTHFLNKPVDNEYLFEIIDTYCMGNKNHDILLIHQYNPEESCVKAVADEKKISYFEVNDPKFAKVYLKNNAPKVVCVELPWNQYEKIKNKIHHNHIFYVENRQNMEELTSFI